MTDRGFWWRGGDPLLVSFAVEDFGEIDPHRRTVQIASLVERQ